MSKWSGLRELEVPICIPEKGHDWQGWDPRRGRYKDLLPQSSSVEGGEDRGKKCFPRWVYFSSYFVFLELFLLCNYALLFKGDLVPFSKKSSFFLPLFFLSFFLFFFPSLLRFARNFRVLLRPGVLLSLFDTDKTCGLASWFRNFRAVKKCFRAAGTSWKVL